MTMMRAGVRVACEFAKDSRGGRFRPVVGDSHLRVPHPMPPSRTSTIAMHSTRQKSWFAQGALSSRLSKACDGRRLGLMHVEHRVQLGDDQQLLHPLVQVGERHGATLSAR